MDGLTRNQRLSIACISKNLSPLSGFDIPPIVLVTGRNDLASKLNVAAAVNNSGSEDNRPFNRFSRRLVSLNELRGKYLQWGAGRMIRVAWNNVYRKNAKEVLDVDAPIQIWDTRKMARINGSRLIAETGRNGIVESCGKLSKVPAIWIRNVPEAEEEQVESSTVNAIPRIQETAERAQIGRRADPNSQTQAEMTGQHPRNQPSSSSGSSSQVEMASKHKKATSARIQDSPSSHYQSEKANPSASPCRPVTETLVDSNSTGNSSHSSLLSPLVLDNPRVRGRIDSSTNRRRIASNPRVRGPIDLAPPPVESSIIRSRSLGNPRPSEPIDLRRATPEDSSDSLPLSQQSFRSSFNPRFRRYYLRSDDQALWTETDSIKALCAEAGQIDSNCCYDSFVEEVDTEQMETDLLSGHEGLDLSRIPPRIMPSEPLARAALRKKTTDAFQQES